ncbi:MAG: amidohydrolase, partial [Lacticaseibacillus paracasei]|nr:amidohydrolase [Lacticaseibacillus paracasei]
QVVPTAQFTNGFEPQGTSPHSWQWVSNGISSVAHKGLLLGGKVFALTAYDALANPRLVEDAKEDFAAHFGNKLFESPIPAEVKPR